MKIFKFKTWRSLASLAIVSVCTFTLAQTAILPTAPHANVAQGTHSNVAQGTNATCQAAPPNVPPPKSAVEQARGAQHTAMIITAVIIEQNMPPPKLSPEALASAVIKALRDGTEDVYPGDVAQEWLQRWRDNPKVL